MYTEQAKLDYKKMVEEISPNSKIVINCIKAFAVGGSICVFGQLILSGLKNMGIDKDVAAGFTSIALVFMGVLFTGLGIYPKLGKFAGAGSIVPITGFANAVASPAIEYKKEGYILGVGAKMFIVAGPVIVYGTLASVIVGFIYYITGGRG
ncbi:MAG: stage V sporulation protein AC [Clostridiales bacterium]|jgi:stage V sporulation protein AC|nr:stage V sporulation protein AC [Clostridiales bacterium]